jgi:hypothetical protein
MPLPPESSLFCDVPSECWGSDFGFVLPLWMLPADLGCGSEILNAVDWLMEQPKIKYLNCMDAAKTLRGHSTPADEWICVLPKTLVVLQHGLVASYTYKDKSRPVATVLL